jgi:hypothetical protein
VQQVYFNFISLRNIFGIKNSKLAIILGMNVFRNEAKLSIHVNKENVDLNCDHNSFTYKLTAYKNPFV